MFDISWMESPHDYGRPSLVVFGRLRCCFPLVTSSPTWKFCRSAWCALKAAPPWWLRKDRHFRLGGIPPSRVTPLLVAFTSCVRRTASNIIVRFSLGSSLQIFICQKIFEIRFSYQAWKNIFFLPSSYMISYSCIKFTHTCFSKLSSGWTTTKIWYLTLGFQTLVRVPLLVGEGTRTPWLSPRLGVYS